MNKLGLFVCLVMLAVAMSCGSKTQTNTEDYGDPKSTSEPMDTKVDEISLGAALVKKSDCNTCHHVTNTIIGPSHTDVAKKYEFTEENVQMLADRIIAGGSGVWGQVMMTPHPDLSKDDAILMAKYVLSLDGEKEPE